MSIYKYEVRMMNGEKKSMAEYQGQGLEILDFPCNQFGNQAPGEDEEIASFCTGRYGITFPQFHKIEVNGANEEPLYTYLKAKKGGMFGKKIKWNFTKFLVDREGNVVERFAPTATPESMEEAVKKLIAYNRRGEISHGK